jgi:hypothetical protein
MTLLSPFALLLLLLAAPVVLMYVLRLRRPEREISSSLLWPHLVEDMQANTPWQRLRPSLLLLLQLLVIAGLALALAGPALSRSATVSRDEIVILDESLSMQAQDISPSRFAVAQARARALADSLPPGRVMSVIGMGSQPHLAIVESPQRSSLERAIDSLTPDTRTPNVLAALSLASSLGRQGESTEAVVYTDHSGSLQGLPLSLPFPVKVFRLGGVRNDLGITSFSAAGGKHTRAVLRLHNFGARIAHSDLQLFADGQLADDRPLDIGAGADDAETWDSLPAGIRTLRAHLSVRDDMTADKTAWAVIDPVQQRHVLLVSAGNYFLQTALSLDSGVSLSTEDPAAYLPSDAAGNDVVIFDGFLPKTLPAASVLLVNPPAGSVAGMRFGRRTTTGPVTSQARVQASDVMHYVDLGDVHIARIRQVSLPAWMRTLAVGGSRPVIAAGQNGNTRVALLSFAIQESDWPLRVSFPVLIRNLMSYLAPAALVQPSAVVSGASVTLVPPAGSTELLVTGPSGRQWRLSAPLPPFTDTADPGIYSVQSSSRGAVGALFASNAFAPRGPDVAGPSAETLGRPSSGTSITSPNPLDISWAFAFGALAILALEWWEAFKR